MRLVEESLTSMRQHNTALDRHNELLFFSSGSGGCDSDIAKKFFLLLQKETLAKVKKRLKVAKEN